VNQNVRVSGIHIDGMGESFRRKAKAKVLEQKDLMGRKGTRKSFFQKAGGSWWKYGCGSHTTYDNGHP